MGVIFSQPLEGREEAEIVGGDGGGGAGGEMGGCEL